jgi:hypothetical protein
MNLMDKSGKGGREIPAEIFDDERTWQGDYDPYLGTLAHEGRKHRAPPPPRAAHLAGPADDGDPYLAEVARCRFQDSDDS